jgi:hypothetical protein
MCIYDNEWREFCGYCAQLGPPDERGCWLLSGRQDLREKKKDD